jgi:nucleoredoxin
MAFADIFGAKLLSKGGEVATEQALAGKTAVGIYFSAHWCPPCRGFTPQLAEWYNASFAGKGMEIVFVSSDKDDSSFTEYFSDMPWLALPFSERDLKATLSKKYKVQGIPSFVILGPDGETITTDGRSAVAGDPTGENYPWIPPTPAENAKVVLDTLGSELLQKTAGKPIGLYFSAHWCPPCRGFTPKLAEMYKDGLKENMEIIFVSSDRDETSFNEYFAEMPWLALPFNKRSEKEKLSKICGVEGIPSFAVINPDGTTITTEGRSKLMSDPKGETVPDGWLPQPCNDINDDPSPLNEEQCVIMMAGQDSAGALAVKAVASEYHEAAGKVLDAMPFRFFWAPDGGVTGQVRKLTSVDAERLILLDIPDDGAFYVCESEEITVNTVKQFINDVKDKKVERKQLQK